MSGHLQLVVCVNKLSGFRNRMSEGLPSRLSINVFVLRGAPCLDAALHPLGRSFSFD